jgi:hypothetical protein
MPEKVQQEKPRQQATEDHKKEYTAILSLVVGRVVYLFHYLPIEALFKSAGQGLHWQYCALK